MHLLQKLFTGSVIALALTGSHAFADTPQGNLDAAIAEAQQTLGQISFEGAADPDALRKKLADMLARVAKCEVGLLRDIKNALMGFLQSSAFDPLHDLINSDDTLTPEEDFFREIAKRLFGGALKKDLENADSLGLFSSLERALAQDWHPPRDSSDVIKKMFDPLWDKALAGAVGKGKLGAAIRQLALVRKLLAQMANIRVLHAKAYPQKSAPPTSGGKVLTPPKAPISRVQGGTTVARVGSEEAKNLFTLAAKPGGATKTMRVSRNALVLTLSKNPKNERFVCAAARWKNKRGKVSARFQLPRGKTPTCITEQDVPLFKKNGFNIEQADELSVVLVPLKIGW